MRKLKGTMRTYLVRGLMVAAPFVVSLFAVVLVYNFLLSGLTDLFAPLVQGFIPRGWPHSPAVIAIFELVLSSAVLVAIGLATSWKPVQKVVRVVDRVFHAIPLVSFVYSAASRVTSLTGSSRTQQFQRGVLYEWKGIGLRYAGLVTNEYEDADGTKWLVVLIPASPVPTGGSLVQVREDQVVADLEPEDVLRYAVSLGTLLPQSPSDK